MNTQERARELYESFVNGNRKLVAKEIDETPGADAIELVLAISEHLNSSDMGLLLRLIAMRKAP